jgi:hypothetical protein
MFLTDEEYDEKVTTPALELEEELQALIVPKIVEFFSTKGITITEEQVQTPGNGFEKGSILYEALKDLFKKHL